MTELGSPNALLESNIETRTKKGSLISKRDGTRYQITSKRTLFDIALCNSKQEKLNESKSRRQEGKDERFNNRRYIKSSTFCLFTSNAAQIGSKDAITSP